jgi:hypothetical protein
MPALSREISNATVLPELANIEQTQRLLAFAKYWDYYEGRQKKFLAIREGEPDYNMVVNLCGRVVDQSVNFLVGTAPGFDLPGDDDQTAAQEVLLDAWLDENDFEDFVSDLFTMAAVTGHAFVKLIPDGENVRPVALDSGLVTAFWEPADKTKALAYMILWSDGSGKSVREDHVYRGGMWEIISYTGQGKDWMETGRTEWRYPFAQIVDWKNLPAPRGYYGKSDLEQVVNLNDAYNFRQSNTNKILYIHAHPRTIGFGVTKEQVQKSGIDGLWLIPNETARMENLEMQTDLSSSRQQAMDIKTDFFSDSQTVDVSTVKDKAGQLTNFGLRLMFAEALAKNNKKRRLAERGLAEMIWRAGVLMGRNWKGVNVKWGDPLPENTNEQIANAKETIGMGVASRQTESERLGYDWERESTRMADERAQSAAGLGELMMGALRDNGGNPQDGNSDGGGE